MQVIVTRPQDDAQRWVQGLNARGMQALALPLLVIAPVPEPAALRRAWEQVDAYAAVMFVSGSAVAHFFMHKPAAARAFTTRSGVRTRAWAVGPGTVRVLRAQGVDEACIDAPPADAPQFDSQALWQQVGAAVHSASRVLIVRGADAPDLGAGAPLPDAAMVGRDWLARQLRDHGVQVDFVAAYVRAPAQFDALERETAQAAACDGSVWLFSSAQAVRALAANLPETDWSTARALATHGRIAQAARNIGFGVVIESRPDIEEIVASIESMA